MAFAIVVNMSATARQLFSSYERQTARDRVLKAPPPRTHSLGCFFRLDRIQERAYKDQCSRDKAL